ncbi:MAG: hypothetical protein LC635_01575 [Pseudonocardiaceae bacterium]|nr:hypothetical protein [Pseudonocardiaceae bacterium]
MAALSFLDREHTIARPGYSRWLIPPAALAIHLGGGALVASPLSRQLMSRYRRGHRRVRPAGVHVGGVRRRLLTAWAAAGIAGPLIINGFLDAQGKPGELVAADYRPALFTMVGVLAVGFVANLLVRPVAPRFHESGRSDAFAEAGRSTSAGGR